MNADSNKVDQLIDLATRMRMAQKLYFRTRSRDDLERSKKLERELDSLLANFHTLL